MIDQLDTTLDPTPTLAEIENTQSKTNFNSNLNLTWGYS